MRATLHRAGRPEGESLFDGGGPRARGSRAGSRVMSRAGSRVMSRVVSRVMSRVGSRVDRLNLVLVSFLASLVSVATMGI